MFYSHHTYVRLILYLGVCLKILISAFPNIQIIITIPWVYNISRQYIHLNRTLVIILTKPNEPDRVRAHIAATCGGPFAKLQ